MLPWKPITAALVIFVAGVVSGGMGMQLYRARWQATPPRLPVGGPPSPGFSQRMDFMRRMGDRLGLSEAQRTRIDEILRDSQQRSRELWEPLAPKFKEEMERTKRLIDAELTAEQRAKAEIFQRERPPGSPGDRGPGRWREGDGQRPRGRGPERNPSEYGPFPPRAEAPHPDGPSDGAMPPRPEPPPPDRPSGAAAPPSGPAPPTE